MEEQEKQYRIMHFSTMSGLVDFLNKIDLPREDLIKIQPVEGEYLMIYYR